MTTAAAAPEATVRALYDAFARRDRAGILAVMAPDIAWVQNDGFPNGGTHVGAEHVVDDVLGRFRTEWSAWRVTIREYLPSGGTVVVLGDYHGTHAATGRAMTAAFAHVYRVADGRIARFEQFTDTWMVREAAGEAVGRPGDGRAGVTEQARPPAA